MNINLIYIEQIKNVLKDLKYDKFACDLSINNLKEIKGLYVPESKEIYINLSAEQWKDLTEQELISNLTDTIVHETIHNIIDKTRVKRTDEGEEKVTRMLAGQDLAFELGLINKPSTK